MKILIVSFLLAFCVQAAMAETPNPNLDKLVDKIGPTFWSPPEKRLVRGTQYKKGKGASDSESEKGISNEKIRLQYASKDKAGTLSVPAWLPRGSMVKIHTADGVLSYNPMLYEFDHQQISEFTTQPAASVAAPPPVAGPSDEELMQRIQAQDERALEILMKRYEAMLRSVVGRMLAIDQDVTDVVEEVFLGIWNQASNFDTTRGKAIAWIITMARRRAIDRVRRRQAYDRAEMRFRISTDTGAQHLASDDVEQCAASSDNAAMFEDLISKLPEAQARVVKMAFYQGMSQREIARETGLPLGTIKTRLELGLKKLRVAVSALGTKEDLLVPAA